MPITSVIAQLRTTDLKESIRFYTEKIGLVLEFQYEDFYAGIRAGTSLPPELVGARSSITFVDDGDFHLYFGTDDIAALAKRSSTRSARAGRARHPVGHEGARYQGQPGPYLVLRPEPIG
jgi:catechol 2,3-dioxygenase-like lactoylglutathione lyase family enzyme